jgi:formate dehydrogenase maturation protein FdhE
MIIDAETRTDARSTPACPACGATQAESRALASQSVYLRCAACHQTWIIDERRTMPRPEDHRKRC